jgi:hypothetical protein
VVKRAGGHNCTWAKYGAITLAEQVTGFRNAIDLGFDPRGRGRI